MSFILDALKKSDAERQRQSTPGFADIPDARESSRTPRWMWAVGALLAVNLVVLVVILVRHEPGLERTGSISQAIDVPETAQGATFSEFVAEAKETRREVEAETATEPPSPAPEPEPEPADATETAAPPAREPARGQVTAALASLNELRANGTLQLPDLHLDLHVYSDAPGDRFVMVNMTKYTEGESLAEGPLVKEITPVGVILEHQGTEFLIPRQ